MSRTRAFDDGYGPAGSCVTSWLVLAAFGCSGQTSEQRAQTLLFLDTNAPVVGQLAASGELAGALAVDTLRIDVLSEDGAVLETRELAAPDARDWPVSLGIVGTERTRLRVRAFRAENARASEAGPLVPVRNLALDRLLEVQPADTFQRLHVTLDAACFNAPPSFAGGWATCVDAERLDVPPATGLEKVERAPVATVGSSRLASPVPCRATPPAGTLCIPGGAGLLGDEQAALFAQGQAEEPSPSRIVHVSPFFLDRTEVTVGRYRLALEGGRLTRPEPTLRDPDRETFDQCTYLGPANPDNDGLPLNCVTYETAQELCRLAGGDLPTETQWEYAARARGSALDFPWGSDFPECCTASLERRTSADLPTACPEWGLEPVGSHQDAAGCSGKVDLSRDGVLDLAGSVSEWTRDNYRAYEDACWASRGVLVDPECIDETANAHTARGSYFGAGFGTALLVRRTWGATGATLGFRCSYPDEGRP